MSLKVLYISSFFPQRCGIATYTWNLAQAVKGVDEGCQLAFLTFKTDEASLNAEKRFEIPGDIFRCLIKEDKASYSFSAQLINKSDVDLVHLQHEYGLFGGMFGCHIVGLVEKLRKPMVVTFHSVKPNPSIRLKKVTNTVAGKAEAVIVHTKSGAELLTTYYEVDEGRVHIIPHGSPETSQRIVDMTCLPGELKVLGHHPILLNFGLIRPSKGLEYAVKALTLVKEKHPDVLLLIAGQTHPSQLMVAGEKYRRKLIKLAEKMGVKENVRFINRFLDEGEIVKCLMISDFYVIPYTGQEQISSGTLAYALGCGKTVISTPFRHAVEVLLDEPPHLNEILKIRRALFGRRGVLVPFKDEKALAEAILTLMEDEDLRKSIEKEALKYAFNTSWRKVGERHLNLYRNVLCVEAAAPVNI
jgi:glycosyltransferase involved in cell wall biosynthesis